MEPLSAITVVSFVLQFLHYGSKIFKTSSQIYRSANGALIEHNELELIIRNIGQICTKLAQHAIPLQEAKPGTDAHALALLSSSCEDVAKELLRVLHDLKMSNVKHPKLASVLQAIYTVRSSSDVKSLANRIKELRDELLFQLTYLMYDQNSLVLAELRILSNSQKNLEINFNDRLEKLSEDVTDALKPIREAIEMGKRRGKKLKHAEKLKLIRSSGIVQPDLDFLSEKFSGMIEDAVDMIKFQKIQNSLRFRGMRRRRDNIQRVQDHTMDWIFDKYDNDASPRHDFREFLETGEGVFLVVGKAGSGKSSLFKHLSDHARTKALLKKWAGSNQLVVADFYFWVSNTEEARSQEGLLRSWLREVLRQAPQLVSRISMDLSLIVDDDMDIWTRETLFRTFFELCAAQDTGVRVCLFVDGFDEYCGELEDLVEVVQNIAASPGVKICASTRPRTTFMKSLASDPKKTLQLQDFTRNDISEYVRSELERHPQFRKLQEKDGNCEFLVGRVVDKANGVFLWVNLAVRSLRKGLDNVDTVPELMRRIDALPSRLRDYYQQMLDSMDENYQEQRAKIILTSLAASEPLPLLVIHYIAEDDPVSNMDSAIWEWPENEIIAIYEEELRPRIIARCEDLMEIQSDLGKDPISGWTLDFIHRTARDYLGEQDLQAQLGQHVPSNFDPHVFLCKSLVAITKSLPLKSGVYPWLVKDLTRLFVHHACEVYDHIQKWDVPLICEMDRVLSTHYYRHRSWLYEPAGGRNFCRGTLLEILDAARPKSGAACLMQTELGDQSRDLALRSRKQSDPGPSPVPLLQTVQTSRGGIRGFFGRRRVSRGQ